MNARRLFGEPLLHFLLLGALLFAGYRIVHGAAPAPAGRIEITAADLARLRLAWQSQWGRAPDAAELKDLVAKEVHDEILYREALAMGLDRDDVIVKRRLAQKVAYLTDDGGQPPTPQQLQSWYRDHAEDYKDAPRISIRQLYFSTDLRGARAEAAAAQALRQLQGAGGDADAGVGDPFAGATRYVEKSRHEIDQAFGRDFAAAVFRLEPQGWRGPIRSGLGWHLVWVDERTTPSLRPYAEVEAQVRDDWLRAEHESLQRQYYARVSRHYEVVVDTAAALPGSPAPAAVTVGSATP
ncbi:MAG: peptidyl-prolyl cis-trans isomerase [Burkholderiales bacterium]|nr:peptidyl-prolyl cis-trans isomerase [Burkholderiales bacterium]